MLWEIKDDYIDILNLMSGGDIYQCEYDVIFYLCQRYSQWASCIGKGPRDVLLRTNKTSSGGITWVEIWNMLEDFKENIVSSLSSQLDTMELKKKWEETELALSIFYSKCGKTHPLRECPLNQIEAYGICEERNSTSQCPFISGLKVVYQEENGEVDQLCHIT